MASSDSLARENLWQIMAEDSILVESIELLKTYEHCKSVRVLGEKAKPLVWIVVLKQGEYYPCIG